MGEAREFLPPAARGSYSAELGELAIQVSLPVELSCPPSPPPPPPLSTLPPPPAPLPPLPPPSVRPKLAEKQIAQLLRPKKVIHDWKHCEIFFEETRQTCKVLVVPSSCEDPEEVIKKLFSTFGLTEPSMVCTAQSGYGENGKFMEHFKEKISDPDTTSPKEQSVSPDQKSSTDTSGQPGSSKQTGESIANLLFERHRHEEWVTIQYREGYRDRIRKELGNDVQDKDVAVKTKAKETMSLNELERRSVDELKKLFPIQVKKENRDDKLHWGKTEHSQRARYKQKVTDLMHGVCAAASEAGAWLICQGDCSIGASPKNGSIFIPGISSFKKEHPSTASNLSCIGFRFEHYHSDAYKNIESEDPHVLLDSPFDIPVPLNSDEFAEPLDRAVANQLIYPDISKKLFLHEHVGNFTPARKVYQWALNPHMSHLVVGGQVVEETVALLTDIVSAVHLVIGGSDRLSISRAMEEASHGKVIIMVNSGIWANALANAVLEKIRQEKQRVFKRKREQAKYEKKQVVDCKKETHETGGVEVELSDAIDTSRFLMLDALVESIDTVVKQFSSALASLTGSERNELGFAQSEHERLLNAWNLHMSMKYNMGTLSSWNLVLGFGLLAMSLAATVTPILSLSYNSNVANEELEGVLIDFEDDVRRGFRVACSVLPLALAFMQGCESLFALDKKHAVLHVVGQRVLGEIYRYRTRTGIYRPKTNTASLHGLLQHRQTESSSQENTKTPQQSAGNTSEGSKKVASDPSVGQTETSSQENIQTAQQSAKSTSEKLASDLSKDEAARPSSQGHTKMKAPQIEKNIGQLNRTIFSEQLDSLQESALSQGLHLDNLPDAPESFRRKIISQLYPGDLSDPWRLRRYCSCLCCCARLSVIHSSHSSYSSSFSSSFCPSWLPCFHSPPAAAPHPLLSAREPTQHVARRGLRDDGISELSAGDYLIFRVEPVLLYLKNQRPVLSLAYYVQRVIMLILALVGGLLGVFNLQVFIPVVIALIAAVERLGSFLHLREQIESTCAAISQVDSLIMWWHGLSMVEQRNAVNKDHLVSVTESAMEAVAVAYGNAVMPPKERTPPREEKDDTDDSERKKDLEGKDDSSRKKNA